MKTIVQTPHGRVIIKNGRIIESPENIIASLDNNLNILNISEESFDYNYEGDWGADYEDLGNYDLSSAFNSGASYVCVG